MWPAVAHARDEIIPPSALTPPTIRPAEPRRDTDVRLPAPLPGPAAPRAPANLDVLITSVALDGAFPEMEAANEKARSLAGERLSVAAIYEFAKSLEDEYVRAGYIFVRVTVPPQNLRDNGRLVFVVIDGFVEALDVSGIPESVRNAVAERVLPLVGQRHLRREEVERRLLLAGDIPGLTLKSTLARGASEGGVRLLLQGEHRPMTGSLGIDNRNPSALGTWQLRGAVAFNSAAGRGEQFYGTIGLGTNVASAFDGTSQLSLYGAGVVMPFGTEGFTANPEFTTSKTATPATSGAPATQGKFDRVALRLRSPWMRTKQQSLYFSVAGEYIQPEITAPDFNAKISSDRYGVIRAGPEYEVALENAGILRGGFSYSQGIGGRSESDATATAIPLSRSGTTPRFGKLNVSTRYTHPLPEKLRLDLIGSGQWSMSKPLFRSEQFGLDGSEGVSSYVPGTFNADTGAVVRAELSRPFDFPIHSQSGVRSGTISPYLFSATGRGWLYSATVLEQSRFTASAVGGGVRINIDSSIRERGISVGFELARQFTDIANQSQGWRANFIATAVY